MGPTATPRCSRGGEGTGLRPFAYPDPTTSLGIMIKAELLTEALREVKP